MASFSEYRARDWDDRRLMLAALLSVVLHGLVVLLLLLEPWTWRIQPEPPPLLAEFVMPEPPKAAPPPAPAPAPPAPQAQQTLPEPPPPAPVPQLQRGAPVTDRSVAPPSAGERNRQQSRTAEQQQPQPQDQPGPRPRAAQEPPQQRPNQAQSGNRQAGPAGGAPGMPGERMTQSESDFFLSQIITLWPIDFDAPQFANIQIDGAYMVLANGMLAPPFGKNDPWDMNAMIRGWDKIAADPRPQAIALRTAMETLMRAMRNAQPMTMPPNAQGYPKILVMDFKVGDLQ